MTERYEDDREEFELNCLNGERENDFEIDCPCCGEVFDEIDADGSGLCPECQYDERMRDDRATYDGRAL